MAGGFAADVLAGSAQYRVNVKIRLNANLSGLEALSD